jgi:hypothetical protein
MRFHPAPPILAMAALVTSGCTRAPATGSLPADAVVSIGVIAAGGLIPQVSGPVTLAFLPGRATPGQVPAHRFAAPPTLDGDAAEWSGWPATEVALAPAGQAAGLSAPGWYCRWRTHHSQVIDPATGLPACPSPCAPDAPPGTQGDGSAGCSVPLPPYDQGVASVVVRAGFDDQTIYLLLQWSAPEPAVLPATGRWDPAAVAWQLDRSPSEDAAYLSFAIGDGAPAHAARGCAFACHVAAAPTLIVPPSPAPTPWPPPGYLADFSCHTGAPGERLDVWAWRAATTSPYGLAYDLRIESTGPAGDRCGAAGEPACAVAEVRAGARWASGTWTLELARRRLTGDPDDAQFLARRPGAAQGGGGSWSALSAQILVPRCATTACHAGGTPPPSGVPVSLDADVGWSQLVSAPSTEAPLQLVEPGQPGASYLVNKLRGTQASVGGWGDRMPPPSAGEPLTEEQVLTIEAWISSGATRE